MCHVVEAQSFALTSIFFMGKESLLSFVCAVALRRSKGKGNVEMFVIVFRDTGYSHNLIGILALCSGWLATRFISA